MTDGAIVGIDDGSLDCNKVGMTEGEVLGFPLVSNDGNVLGSEDGTLLEAVDGLILGNELGR